MKNGFFWPDTDTVDMRPTGKRYLTCDNCGLYKKCHSPRMPATGKGKKGILIIAEAPGETEDIRGVQLVGKDGQYLRNVMCDLGYDLDRDCRKINAINCRPPKNRPPKNYEIDTCRRYVWKEIRTFQPKVIILLGGTSLLSFLSHRIHKDVGGISKWRGFTIPDREVGAWVCPVLHPSYLTRETTPASAETIFRKDLRRALNMVHEPLPVNLIKEKFINIITSRDEVTAVLNRLNDGEWPRFAMDYETTGLKPFAKGHEIYSVSVCPSRKFTASFPFKFVDKEKWKRLMRNREIGKIASNFKFEQVWNREIEGYNILGWDWDTMLGAHVWDNRRGITSIKFLAYLHFGIIDYSSPVGKYLKSNDEKNANSFNTIKDAPLRPLLLYGGYDSLLEFMESKVQKGEILQ